MASSHGSCEGLEALAPFAVQLTEALCEQLTEDLPWPVGFRVWRAEEDATAVVRLDLLFPWTAYSVARAFSRSWAVGEFCPLCHRDSLASVLPNARWDYKCKPCRRRIRAKFTAAQVSLNLTGEDQERIAHRAGQEGFYEPSLMAEAYSAELQARFQELERVVAFRTQQDGMAVLEAGLFASLFVGSVEQIMGTFGGPRR